MLDFFGRGPLMLLLKLQAVSVFLKEASFFSGIALGSTRVLAKLWRKYT